MSAQSTGFASQAPQAPDPQREGGSPPADDPADLEAEQDEGLVEDRIEDAGDEPAAEVNDAPPVEAEPKAPAGGDPEAQERLTQLERDLANAQSILDDIDAMARRDPELGAKLGYQNGQSQRADSRKHFEATINDPQNGLSEKAAQVLLKGMAPVFEELDFLRSQYGHLDKGYRGVSKTLGSQEYQNTLAAEGVSKAVQATPQWQKHVRGLEQDEDYKSIGKQSARARYAARTWTAKAAQAGDRKDTRALLETAAGVRNGQQRRATSPSVHERIVQVKKNGDPAFAVKEGFRIRQEAAKAGKRPPQIQYVD